jgi:site-specific DNA recombinase
MSAKVLRCAIYTRVSSDAGLEQEFNSLDAQREAAEAFIKSQTHEGWRLLRERYDDGGFSGGSLDRPALQTLLEQVRRRRIDIIVVYKVDRLTRSLADFAKLVELFDAHGVSFVSVTQAFNTTNSMGRLTLNVLLSFAQFEREVTGERIRDKIAASKKKGIWMGGAVPYGYRVENRKLLVVEEEAANVRLIFDLYSKLGSVRAVQQELSDRNIRTRPRKLASGRIIGGIRFTNGPLAVILRNRLYLGELKHKDKYWPGEHAAIIDTFVFEAVHEKLAGQRRSALSDRANSGSPLLGKLFNAAGERMSPGYATKKGIRYRYYISTSAMQSRPQDLDAVHRLPADALEHAVTAGLSDQVQSISQLERVVVHHDRIDITLAGAPDDPDSPPLKIVVPWSKPSMTRRKEILQPTDLAQSQRPMEGDERLRLLRGIATARKWLVEIIAHTSDLATIASREGKSERAVRMTLSLAFLDPRLIKAAIAGTLPRGYGITRMFDLPPLFEDQWLALGLFRPTR